MSSTLLSRRKAAVSKANAASAPSTRPASEHREPGKKGPVAKKEPELKKQGDFLDEEMLVDLVDLFIELRKRQTRGSRPLSSLPNKLSSHFAKKCFLSQSRTEIVDRLFNERHSLVGEPLLSFFSPSNPVPPQFVCVKNLVADSISTKPESINRACLFPLKMCYSIAKGERPQEDLSFVARKALFVLQLVERFGSIEVSPAVPDLK